MPSRPLEQDELPAFTNRNPRCTRCGNRQLVRVHFDRDCADARGDHYYWLCPCGLGGSSAGRG